MTPARLPARALIALVALGASLGATACGSLRPTEPSQAALYEDAVRLVENRETTGWVIDRIAYEELGDAVMQSACRVGPDRRAGLLSWLDAAIVAAGGPAADAYVRAGHDKDAVEDILTLERVRGLVAWADAIAQADCPFWLEPVDAFDGIQGDKDRVVLLLESRGSLGISLSDGDTGLGGGGQGRLQIGYGFGHDLSVFVGGELGGAAIFQPQPDDGPRELEGSVVGAVPLVWRFHDGASLWDIEVALTGIYRDATDNLALGGRIAFAYGLATPRVGAFQPVAVLWVGYEVYPAQDGEPVYHFIGLGTRVGLDIDP